MDLQWILSQEYDHSIEACTQAWLSSGVDRAFLVDRPKGVKWDCDVSATAARAGISLLSSLRAMRHMARPVLGCGASGVCIHASGVRISVAGTPHSRPASGVCI